MDVQKTQAIALPGVYAVETRGPAQQDGEMIQAVRAVNAAELLGTQRELVFSRDSDSGRPVLRIVDRDTGEVLRQAPPEYALRLARQLRRGGR